MFAFETLSVKPLPANGAPGPGVFTPATSVTGVGVQTVAPDGGVPVPL